MIYRVVTDSRFIGFSYVDPLMPYGVDPYNWTYEYQTLFEEIPGQIDRQLCRFFKAPLLANWRMAQSLGIVLDGHGVEMIPELIAFVDKTYVSQKVKEIIEHEDPFGHQFWPISLLDENGCPIDGVQYYRMNMRRYVKIIESSGPVQEVDFYPHDVYGGARYIASIQNIPEIRRCIEEIPMWRCANDLTVQGPLFLGPSMMAALKQGGVKGIREYSGKGGCAGEYVSHV